MCLTVCFLFNNIIVAQSGSVVAFYNLENLFDVYDDPHTRDNDFLPKGKYHWTPQQYQHKIANMSRIIRDIGVNTLGEAPDIIGVAEIENAAVLQSIVSHPYLANDTYSYIHFDSPDRRGIDVALLYKKHKFKPTSFDKIPLKIYNAKTKKRIYTRDQLMVGGLLDGQQIYIIVNHWPSRRGGLSRSSPLRAKAALLNRQIIDSIKAENPEAKIIGMGDFNDNPTDDSFKKMLKTSRIRDSKNPRLLYNPFEMMYQKGMGTLTYRNEWFLFDQIYCTANLLAENSPTHQWHYVNAGIYNPNELITPNGDYKGSPYRSFVNQKYTGGYADHFPVYIILEK